MRARGQARTCQTRPKQQGSVAEGQAQAADAGIEAQRTCCSTIHCGIRCTSSTTQQAAAIAVCITQHAKNRSSAASRQVGWGGEQRGLHAERITRKRAACRRAGTADRRQTSDTRRGVATRRVIVSGCRRERARVQSSPTTKPSAMNWPCSPGYRNMRPPLRAARQKHKRMSKAAISEQQNEMREPEREARHNRRSTATHTWLSRHSTTAAQTLERVTAGARSDRKSEPRKDSRLRQRHERHFADDVVHPTRNAEPVE